MAYKLYTSGNYVYLIDLDTGKQYEGHSKEVLHRRQALDSESFAFRGLNQFEDNKLIPFSEIQDKDGNLYSLTYTSQTFSDFLDTELGKYSPQGGGRIYVNQLNYKETICSKIDSSKEYFIDEVINIGSEYITVPPSGIYVRGYSFDTSIIKSTADDNYIFRSESEVIGSGNVIFTDIGIEASGLNSKVFNLYDYNGFNAIELQRVNFNSCTSLGDLYNYRQYLESGTGRFGGTPELCFNGSFNGARITTSITRNIGNITALFKTGTGLVFSGRFITDMNLDLNNTGAFFDFSESNFLNDESLVIEGALVSRNGNFDSSDDTIYPNINNSSVKSLWEGNTGLPSTSKYIKIKCDTEVTTTISAQNTYYPLEGIMIIERSSHFESPLNGQLRLLSGSATYNIVGNITIEGTQNRVVDIRVTKSVDGGVSFPNEINHVRRTINALSGVRDVAFIPVNFITELNKGDIVRLEIENTTDTSNLTQEVDSYLIISKL